MMSRSSPMIARSSILPPVSCLSGPEERRVLASPRRGQEPRLRRRSRARSGPAGEQRPHRQASPSRGAGAGAARPRPGIAPRRPPDLLRSIRSRRGRAPVSRSARGRAAVATRAPGAARPPSETPSGACLLARLQKEAGRPFDQGTRRRAGGLGETGPVSREAPPRRARGSGRRGPSASQRAPTRSPAGVAGAPPMRLGRRPRMPSSIVTCRVPRWAKCTEVKRRRRLSRGTPGSRRRAPVALTYRIPVRGPARSGLRETGIRDRGPGCRHGEQTLPRRATEPVAAQDQASAPSRRPRPPSPGGGSASGRRPGLLPQPVIAPMPWIRAPADPRGLDGTAVTHRWRVTLRPAPGPRCIRQSRSDVDKAHPRCARRAPCSARSRDRSRDRERRS